MAHLPPRKLRYRSTTQRSLIPVVVGICGVLLFGVLTAYLLKNGFLLQHNATQKALVSAPSPTPTPHIHTTALLGYGGGTHEGGALTDTILLLRVDDLAKTIFLISIPRDLWIALPLDTQKPPQGEKINAAYALGLDDNWYPHKPKAYQAANDGGGNLAKYALAHVLGEPIDHYIAMSFQAFINVIDTLGGVTIERTTTFTDVWYPVEGKEKDTCDKSEDDLKQIEATLSGYLREQEFPCRYETITFPAGVQTLDGETALKYVRSRHSGTEGGDFYRSQRQRQIIEAVKAKLLTWESVPKLVTLAQQIYAAISTDYRVSDIPQVVQMALDRKGYRIESIALTNENVLKNSTGPHGEYILVPKDDDASFTLIQSYLTDRFSGLTEASSAARLEKRLATPTPTPTSAPLQKSSPTKAPSPAR